MEPRRYGRGTVREAPMPRDELRKLLSYDRGTGILTWLECPAGGNGARRVKPGTPVQCRNAYGRVVVRINGALYQAHRIIWFLETGTWPPHEIDHINGICHDNRWCNLRLATPSENVRYMWQLKHEREGGPKPPPPLRPVRCKNDRVSLEEVAELLSYDPATGHFTWRAARSRRIKIGDRAGSLKREGYVCIRIGPVIHKAHRLAFVMMTEQWPEGEIDHANGIKSDNRWVNLRLATRGQNQHNRSFRVSKSGFRGVHQNRNGYRAQICINRKLIQFPIRPTPEAAYADYCAAAREHHGPFARLT